MGHGLPSSFDWLGVDSSLLGGYGILNTGTLAYNDPSTAPLQHNTVNIPTQDFLDTLPHRRTECPIVVTTPATVRMNVDEQADIKTPSATPNLTIVETFSPTDL